MNGDRDIGQALGRAKARPPAVLNLLAGLPELDLFESEEQKRAALHKVGQSIGVRGTLHGMLILLGVPIATLVAMKFLMSLINVGWIIENSAPALVGVFVAFGPMTRLYRSGFRGALREQLFAAGIPVCRGCGYGLRGHSSDAESCPECGGKLDDGTMMLLLARERDTK